MAAQQPGWRERMARGTAVTTPRPAAGSLLEQEGTYAAGASRFIAGSRIGRWITVASAASAMSAYHIQS